MPLLGGTVLQPNTRAPGLLHHNRKHHLFSNSLHTRTCATGLAAQPLHGVVPPAPHLIGQARIAAWTALPAAKPPA
eukprot:1139838-Pelagomonas_calceolata.AAC.1